MTSEPQASEERRKGGEAPLRVDFGLAIKNFVGPTETPDVDALIAYAERAEALGFESLWAWDHVLLGVEPAFPILEASEIAATEPPTSDELAMLRALDPDRRFLG